MVPRHTTAGREPARIVARVIAAYQLPTGALVIDPFAGSGTTLAVANAAGLRAIGIEADGRWCQVTAARLAATPAP